MPAHRGHPSCDDAGDAFRALPGQPMSGLPGDARFLMGVGAEKAGTSWLHRRLVQHPDVWTPPHKEIHYFDQLYTDIGTGFRPRQVRHAAQGGERDGLGRPGRPGNARQAAVARAPRAGHGDRRRVVSVALRRRRPGVRGGRRDHAGVQRHRDRGVPAHGEVAPRRQDRVPDARPGRPALVCNALLRRHTSRGGRDGLARLDGGLRQAPQQRGQVELPTDHRPHRRHLSRRPCPLRLLRGHLRLGGRAARASSAGCAPCSTSTTTEAGSRTWRR